jgi:hypothetical protein
MAHLFVIVAPLLLAVVEMFHPHPIDLLELPLERWLLVHYAQIGLFPLAALAQVLLVAGLPGYAAALCRTAMLIFGISYVSFDTAAGVVTGVLVRAALATNSPEEWREPILAVWKHAIIGGNSDGVPALAVIGTTAWLIGTLSASVAIRRAGHSWLPVVLLIVSAFGLLVFRTHAWPGGPLTFGALGAAAAVIVKKDRARLA